MQNSTEVIISLPLYRLRDSGTFDGLAVNEREEDVQLLLACGRPS
jgi:hypothetical protein